MNCLDCNLEERASAAVAVCRDCGAGACLDHVVVRSRWLRRNGVIAGTEPVDPPARVLRCLVCDAAASEVDRPADRSRARRHPIARPTRTGR